MWKELIKKIELQSILVLIITVGTGCFLFKIDKIPSSNTRIIGCIIICIGVLYSFVSFFTLNLRENYKDIISEYKSTIRVMRASYRVMQKEYESTLKFTTESQNLKIPGNYKKQIEETTSE